MSALEAADNIARITDSAVASKETKLVEIYMEITYLKETKILPPRKILWKYIHEETGFTGIPSKLKEEIEHKFYS